MVSNQSSSNAGKSRDSGWVPHLTVGALVAGVMAAVQVTWGIASKSDLIALEARTERRLDRIRLDFESHIAETFNQDDWVRGRSEIDKDIEYECRKPIARLETAMGHLRAAFPNNLPEIPGHD